VKWINADYSIDDEDSMLGGESIIKEVHFTLSEAGKFKTHRYREPNDERRYVTSKSTAWNHATYSHFTGHVNNVGCAWCQGFLHFKSRYPIQSVLSSQKQDTTLESMKK